MNTDQFVVLITLLMGTSVLCQDGVGGSKCEGTSCTPAPSGATCAPQYGRDDGCCPEWVCSNGQRVYGMSKSSGGFSGSSSSFSYGTGGGGMPSMNMPSMGGGFPMFGSLGGLNLPLFGRR